MPLGGEGTFCAVIDPLLFSSGPLRDLAHSPGLVVVKNLTIALAIVFWLGLAYWVHRDARSRIGNPVLVFVATLLGLAAPYIGPVVYRLCRPAETIDDVRSRRAELRALEQQLARSGHACPVCSSSVEPDFLACPACTTVLRNPCTTCRAPLEQLWLLCPYCLTPVGPADVDLDAALRAKTKTISLVDDTIPLVPQPEQRVADA